MYFHVLRCKIFPIKFHFLIPKSNIFLNKIVTLELLSPLDRYEQQKFTL